MGVVQEKCLKWLHTQQLQIKWNIYIYISVQIGTVTMGVGLFLTFLTNIFHISWIDIPLKLLVKEAKVDDELDCAGSQWLFVIE